IVTNRELALMRAIEKVFSNTRHILCMWHINKNILAKYKRYFITEENWTEFLRIWQMVAMSNTEQEFATKWNEFLQHYMNKPEVIKYLQETWITYKKCFVSAWTNDYLHFGNTVTSRVEAAHAALKRCLQSSTGNLESVHRKIVSLVKSQAREICAVISSQRIMVQHVHRSFLFEPLLYHVSVFALNKIHDELIKAL
ncbi:12562_t:CDS:2, partial [Gigaspora margarita]